VIVVSEHDWGHHRVGSAFFGTEGRDGSAALDLAVVELIEELVTAAPTGREGLLPVLLGLQRVFHRVSWRVQELVADHFGLSPVQVAGVVSYYPELSSTLRARRGVEVCTGVTCHLRGGDRVLRAMETQFWEPEDTREAEDRPLLRGVRCLGACGRAPVVRVNGRIHGDFEQPDVDDVARMVREDHKGDSEP
jgi:NADH:ubiquinone oxidoreductase subunit E